MLIVRWSRLAPASSHHLSLLCIILQGDETIEMDCASIDNSYSGKISPSAWLHVEMLMDFVLVCMFLRSNLFLSSSGKEIKNHNRDSGSKNIVLKEINKQRRKEGRKEGRKAGRTPDRAVGSVPCSRGGAWLKTVMLLMVLVRVAMRSATAVVMTSVLAMALTKMLMIITTLAACSFQTHFCDVFWLANYTMERAWLPGFMPLFRNASSIDCWWVWDLRKNWYTLYENECVIMASC